MIETALFADSLRSINVDLIFANEMKEEMAIVFGAEEILS